MSSRFDVVDVFVGGLGNRLRDGDVVVVSSKYLAVSQGRVINLHSVRPGSMAKRLASRYRLDPSLAEVIVRESDEIIGGLPGFLLCSKDGLLTPNAGIDKSNVGHGTVVLYPSHPEALAERIREAVKFSLGLTVAVVICDSRLSPTRKGTTGVAIAASGIDAILDMRGRVDLFGNVLKVTSQAVADDLSSAAELLMGESDEGTPIVIVRGMKKSLFRRINYPSKRFAIPMQECVYLRSLGEGRVEYSFRHVARADIR
jgi:coenzyme F420-0:L-glutamate ligase